jgi:hypothetical protein
MTPACTASLAAASQLLRQKFRKTAGEVMWERQIKVKRSGGRMARQYMKVEVTSKGVVVGGPGAPLVSCCAAA